MKTLPAILFLCAFLITSCLPQNIQIPQSPLLSVLEHKSGMIAYIGIDGNIHVSDQGGGNSRSLTDDARIPENQTDPFRLYRLPTWSPDGEQLAFVGLDGQGTDTTGELYVANLDQETATKVHSGAEETPFYLYWSPDNENVSFLSSTTSGGSLILQSIPASGGERVVLDTGVPYYWSWAPDGRVMIAHAGGGSTASAERVAFLRMDSEITEDGVEVFPATFQAPAWSPDGSRILLAARGETGENAIIVTDAAGMPQKTVGTFTGETAFAWSGDGEKVAYIESDQVIADGLLGALHVVDLNTSEEILEDRPIFAFFWSPNSEKIAYFVPILSSVNPAPGAEDEGSEEAIFLQLNVLDVRTGENREHIAFRPTEEFFSVLLYFDQYHQSNTIWSPDNNNLVLSFLDEQGLPGILVVTASGQLQPRLLDRGYLAFWSWK